MVTGDRCRLKPHPAIFRRREDGRGCRSCKKELRRNAGIPALYLHSMVLLAQASVSYAQLPGTTHALVCPHASSRLGSSTGTGGCSLLTPSSEAKGGGPRGWVFYRGYGNTDFYNLRIALPMCRRMSEGRVAAG